MAGSVSQGQTAPRSSLIWIYTACSGSFIQIPSIFNGILKRGQGGPPFC